MTRAGQAGEVLELRLRQVLERSRGCRRSPRGWAGRSRCVTNSSMAVAARRPAAIGLDHGGRAGDAVAAGEDVRLRRLHREAVDVDVAPLVQAHRQVVVEEAGVGGLADGADDRVGLDDEVAALDGHGAAAAGTVGLAELHAHAVQLLAAVGVDGDALRGGEEDHLDALAERLLDLERLGRHLVAGAAVDELDVLGALAQRGAGAVDRGVATADDDDVVAERRRRCPW